VFIVVRAARTEQVRCAWVFREVVAGCAHVSKPSCGLITVF
jgi:hypothetical protein